MENKFLLEEHLAPSQAPRMLVRGTARRRRASGGVGFIAVRRANLAGAYRQKRFARSSLRTNEMFATAFVYAKSAPPILWRCIRNRVSATSLIRCMHKMKSDSSHVSMTQSVALYVPWYRTVQIERNPTQHYI